MAHKILVIDDDLFIRELYAEILQKAGYDVETAEDGEVGISKMQAGGYALILLDMNMPTLGGMGVLNSLQDNPLRQKNGSIILLTNSVDDALVAEGIQKGAASSFVKADMTPSQLLENISKFIK